MHPSDRERLCSLKASAQKRADTFDDIRALLIILFFILASAGLWFVPLLVPGREDTAGGLVIMGAFLAALAVESLLHKEAEASVKYARQLAERLEAALPSPSGAPPPKQEPFDPDRIVC